MNYVIWARPLTNLNDLRSRLLNGDTQNAISAELRKSLLNAHIDPDGWVAWETSTPTERSLVERYFTDVTTELVLEPTWPGLKSLPPLWKQDKSRLS
ncbi:MAG: hypothetical protein SF029_09755 [bacterium]|nr:hypothetical protein [bacterium]